MGTVYKAHRADGAYQRTVAIKLVSRRILSAESEQRFVNERQILANLQHPNIAQLLDGGSADDSVYLVMEYVDGVSFGYDAARDEHTTLQLFTKVCEALQYAHNNLVLHRDIKPDNVLLTQGGEPKLLDFGVAKLSQALAEGDSQDITTLDPAPLTPNFAAPERLLGERATIASDIYSLGVYLYTLLSGQRPYDVQGQSYAAAYRTVESTNLAPASTNPDLEAIVRCAMHEDPARRYGSAAALAQDICRYLENRPITARGDNWTYLLGKLVARHKVALFSAGLGLALLVASLGYSLVQTREAQRQNERAESVTNFMGQIFDSIDPYSGTPLGPDATLQELLAASEDKVAEQFQGDTKMQYDLLALLAGAYSSIRLFDDSYRLLRQAAELHTLQEPADYFTALTIKNDISTGNYDTAAPGCDRWLTLKNPESAPQNRLFTEIHCANLSSLTGKPQEAKARAQRALNSVESLEGELSNRELAMVLQDLTNVLQSTGQFELSAQMLDRAVEHAIEAGPSAYAVLAFLYLNKSLRPNQVGNVEESLKFTTLALETASRSKLARDGLAYAHLQLYQADRLIDAKQVELAKNVFSPARQVLLQDSTEFSPYRSLVYFTDYKLAYLEKDFVRAEASLLESRRIRQDSGERETQWLAATDHALGKVYLQMGKPQQAIPLLRSGYEFYLDLYGAEHKRVQIYHEKLLEAEAVDVSR